MTEKIKLKMKASKRHFVVALLLYILAAGIRIWHIGAFITFDEARWAARGVHFLRGLITGNLLETVQFAAPGVFTMWAVALPTFLKVFLLGHARATWNLVSTQSTLLIPVDEPLLRAAALFLPESRLVLALLNALRTPAVYLLLVRLGLLPTTAFLGATLTALDPFVIGHDRVLHTDGPAATFFLPALLALLIGLESQPTKGRWFFMSGGLATAALLSKSTGGLIIPTLVALSLLHMYRNRKFYRQRDALKGLAAWVAGAIAAAFAFWPAFWGGPVDTMRKVIALSLGFAETPHPTNYFMGKAYVEEAPGPLFYLISLPTRTTPVVWLGVLLALPYLRTKGREGHLSRAIWLALIVFLVPLFFSAKRFERYLVPLYPPLTVLAALGWTRLFRRFPTRAWRHLLAGLVIALQGGAALAEFPYYLTYANPLLAGKPAALYRLPAGWGEGIDQVAKFLNNQPDARIIASNQKPALAPQVPHSIIQVSEESLAVADYAVIYVTDMQMSPTTVALVREHGRKVFTATHGGVTLAEVYAVNTPPDHRAFLDETRPDAVILANAPILALRRDTNHRVIFLNPEEGATGVYRQLNALVAAGIDHLWVMISPLGPNTLTEPLLQALDTTAWRHGEPRELSLQVEAREYTLPRGAHFSPTTPDTPINTPFGGVLVLEQAGVSAEQVGYPQHVGVVLRWRSLTAIPNNLTAFVHVVDSEGHLWSQQDVLIRSAAGEPTRGWTPGTTAETRHLLSLPPGIPPGTYTLIAGVYDEAMNRLSAATKSGTTVILGHIRIVPAHVMPSPADVAPPGERVVELAPNLVLWRVDMPEGSLWPGQQTTVNAVWWARSSPGKDLDVRFSLRDAFGRVRHTWRLPLAPFGTSRWRDGEVMRTLYDLRVPAALPSGKYTLYIGVIPPEEGEKPTAEVPLRLLEVQGRPHQYTLPAQAVPVEGALFGNLIRLRGYTWPSDVTSGTTVPFTLYWQALETPDREYKVFVHVVDSKGNLVAQADHVPQQGKAPTTGWLPQEVIADPVSVTLPQDLRPGTYTVLVGLYDSAGDRLSLPDGNTAYQVLQFRLR